MLDTIICDWPVAFVDVSFVIPKKHTRSWVVYTDLIDLCCILAMPLENLYLASLSPMTSDVLTSSFIYVLG